MRIWLHRQQRHDWFAWRPVVVETSDHKHVIVWLETVVRYWQSQRWDYELKVDPDDPFTRQALEDQKLTDYPGCWEGLLNCRDQACGCVREDQPNQRFVAARAKLLREAADSQPCVKGSH